MSSQVLISYDPFEHLIELLRAEGQDAAAAKLDYLLHRVAWTTSSELLEELGAEICRIQQGTDLQASAIQQSISRSLEMVRRVWPEVE